LYIEYEKEKYIWSDLGRVFKGEKIFKVINIEFGNNT
jgi:hypothetical protein